MKILVATGAWKPALAQTPTIPHGSPPKAEWFVWADTLQAIALYGAPGHSLWIGDVPSGVGSAATWIVPVPPLVDRAQVYVMAAGSGVVSVGGTAIAIQGDPLATTVDLAVLAQGPETGYGMLDLTHSGDISLPDPQTLAVYRDSTIVVYAILLRWSRSQTEIA